MLINYVWVYEDKRVYIIDVRMKVLRYFDK